MTWHPTPAMRKAIQDAQHWGDFPELDDKIDLPLGLRRTGSISLRLVQSFPSRWRH